jgi:hypothetical protein
MIDIHLTATQVCRTLDRINAVLPPGWRAGYVSKDSQRQGWFYAIPPDYRHVTWPRGARWLARLPAAATEEAKELRE